MFFIAVQYILTILHLVNRSFITLVFLCFLLIIVYLFQTQIQKKARKWECKMCGEKQSLKKVNISNLFKTVTLVTYRTLVKKERLK